jgi:hypothetical protein
MDGPMADVSTNGMEVSTNRPVPDALFSFATYD